MSERSEQDEYVYRQISDRVDEVVRDFIDTNYKDAAARQLAAASAGKALVMLGCIYVGNAACLPADVALGAGERLLQSLKDAVQHRN